MNSVVIFDIDGTLACAEHRRPHLEKSPKDWETFFSLCHLDTPIEPVLEILGLLRDYKTIVFFTGRSEVHRPQTLAWLSEQLCRSEASLDPFLFMRPSGDRREDSIVKEEMLDRLLDRAPGTRIWGVFDDRLSVCQMWNRRGVFVFDVAQGRGDF